MPIHIFTRVAALFALGFFISCSTPKAYQSIADSINSGRYDEAIRIAEESIKDQPGKTDTYLYYAFALNEKARRTPKTYERYPILKKMANSLTLAEQTWQKEKKASKYLKAREIRYEAWSREYNEIIRLVDANRKREMNDWLAVFEATENAQLLIKDSIQVIPPQIEALAAMQDWIGLDSVMTIYEPVFGKTDWFEIRNIHKSIRNGDIELAQTLIDNAPNLQKPNDFIAIVLNEKTDIAPLIEDLADFIVKDKPTRGFYLLTAQVMWESVVYQVNSDTVTLKKFYSALNIKKEQWEVDTTFVLRRASIIDKALSSIPVATEDQYLTQTKAILFTNIASKLIEHELEIGFPNDQVSDDAYYFLKKAAPEWTLIIYQFKKNQLENAKTLLQIYDWMDEPYRVEELKKEFSL